MTLANIQRAGFLLLCEVPPEEVVLGVVGRFWKLSENIDRSVSASEFTSFERPGYCKAVWNFLLTPLPGGNTRVTTITRVYCTDDKSRRAFRRYWMLVGPFSGLIRMAMLRTIDRLARPGR